MDWVVIGMRIRCQREYMGLTREQLAEKIEVTPKFCADIELGVKGMSVPTLCRISETLRISTDYILYGREVTSGQEPIVRMLESCTAVERNFAEQLLKTFLAATNAVAGSS